MKKLSMPCLFVLMLSVGAIANLDTAMAAPFAYITNRDSQDVSVIDVGSNTVAQTIAVGHGPYGVAANLEGTRVYVACYAEKKVYIIDTSTHEVIAEIPMGSGDIPTGVAVNQPGTRLYVTNQGSNTVSVIDTSDHSIIATVPVGNSPYGVAVNPSGTRVYVANLDTSFVSVIDTNSNTVIATVTVGTGPFGLAVNRSGKKVYAANKYSDNVSVIDTETNTVMTTIQVGKAPHGVALNPTGTRAYVANRDDNSVSVIDTKTDTVMATIPVGNTLHGIATNPEGNRVYVASFGSDTVSVIDATTNEVIPGDIAVGTKPVALGQFINRGSIWKGSVSFSIKLTSPVTDTSGNTKFQTFSVPVTGAFSLYEEGGLPNQVTFISEDSTIFSQFRSISYIGTEIVKGKTDQSRLVGAGDLSMAFSGTTLTGTVYLDGKETLKKNGVGEVISRTLSGKIAGGNNLVTFTVNVKATLTK